MKIRFNRTIPTEYGAFHFGQVIEIEKPTPDMQKWLNVPLADGTYRAEVVREDNEPEFATVEAGTEKAVTRRSKRRA